MKKTVVLIGFISGLAAVILSVTKFYSLAVVPIVIGVSSGLLLVNISKKHSEKIKPIQYIFICVIISLGLVLYKGISENMAPTTNEQILPQKKLILTL